MSFYADLHIHSKYSRACSRDCDLEHLAWWAGRKGIRVVGTGDFTHPGWIEELRTQLVPAEPGLFRLHPELERSVMDRLPAACRSPVRFLLSSEISTIYKRDDRTRKVHHLLYAPDFDAVAEITRQLDRIGNLASDGRPILGLDSRNLLEITLGGGEGCYLMPAHVWTPWFAALGSQSGFDAIDDCYADLASHVFAIETGLSSDPEMNWRVSSLDRYRLVSNSDAHSPPMLGREATVFDTETDYFSMLAALRTGEGLGGTVEFFPEEGKYHLDGHRACDVRTAPTETRDLQGRCPQCGKPLTIGVLHRVEALADRPDGYRPVQPDAYRCLVPLPEIVGEIVGYGPKSKAVTERVSTLVNRLGPELGILGDLPVDEVARAGGSSLLAEALTRLRRGEVHREAGYDGVYGKISLFAPGELARAKGAATLFDLPTEDSNGQTPRTARRARATTTPHDPDTSEPVAHEQPEPSVPGGVLEGLDADQRAVVETAGGPLVIVAGPGAGKTRVLTHLIAYRITNLRVPPQHWLAVTFTRRASAELRERLALLLPSDARRVQVTTFHGLGLSVVRERFGELGFDAPPRVCDDAVRLALLGELQLCPPSMLRTVAAQLGEARRQQATSPLAPTPATEQEPVVPIDSLLESYETELHRRGLIDFDELITAPIRLLETNPEIREHYRQRWTDIAVDEYQDIDDLQYRLLRLLSRPDSNLSVIGDPDQAIYGFRGGDVRYFLRFREDFPTALVVELTRNYRSTPTIVNGALQAIRPSSLVADRKLTSARPASADEQIVIHHASDEQAEAEAVAQMIEDLLGGTSFSTLDANTAERVVQHQLSFSDFAVLYRTAAQGVPIADALARRGFPAQVRSHERLTNRPEVQTVMEILLNGHHDENSSVTDRVEVAIASMANSPTPIDEQTADMLIDLTNAHGDDLPGYLNALALGVEVDLWDPRVDRVSLLTLHASKGLEFPVVFIVGCEEAMLPFSWQRRDKQPPDGQQHGVDGSNVDESNGGIEDNVDEERRLFFVGMTRATTHLVLTSAQRRQRWGVTRVCVPSRFLADIPQSLVHERIQVPTGRTREKSAYRQLRML